MGKRIIIGSMLVLTLLLLMPSIPAIQQKTIEDKAYSDLEEKLETINLNGLEEIEELDGIKHPILYDLVWRIMNFRYDLHMKLMDISIYIDFLHNRWIIHPLLFIWAHYLFYSVYIRSFLWNGVSDILGWNWDLPD